MDWDSKDRESVFFLNIRSHQEDIFVLIWARRKECLMCDYFNAYKRWMISNILLERSESGVLFYFFYCLFFSIFLSGRVTALYIVNIWCGHVSPSSNPPSSSSLEQKIPHIVRLIAYFMEPWAKMHLQTKTAETDLIGCLIGRSQPCTVIIQLNGCVLY